MLRVRQLLEDVLSESDNVIHVAFGEGGGRIELKRELSAGPEPTRTEPRKDPLDDLYSASDVARLFSLAASRLRYWDRTGFLSPTGRRGRRRCYTFQDLVSVRAAKALIDAGVPLQRVRRSVDSLRSMWPKVTRPLTELRVLADGNSLVVSDAEGRYEPSTGQRVLDFELTELRDDVVRTLQRHGELDPNKRAAYEHYLEGCRLDEDESTFAQAEEMYRLATELDPELANALTNLGNVRFRRGFPKDAEELYQKALAIDSDQPEAYYNLGFLYYERGDAKAAVPCFARAVETDPAFADAHFNLAMALEEVGQRANAKKHWQVYLQLEPQGAWAEVARRHLKRR
ncbi:MAG: domain/radical binding domain protein [Myxococcaceae bacterium]|nr:domain/radical binding domain protein [Myxococcaceae bacterium]